MTRLIALRPVSILDGCARQQKGGRLEWGGNVCPPAPLQSTRDFKLITTVYVYVCVFECMCVNMGIRVFEQQERIGETRSVWCAWISTDSRGILIAGRRKNNILNDIEKWAGLYDKSLMRRPKIRFEFE